MGALWGALVLNVKKTQSPLHRWHSSETVCMKVPLGSLLPHWPMLGGSPGSGVLNVQTFGDAGELWSDLVSPLLVQMRSQALETKFTSQYLTE